MKKLSERGASAVESDQNKRKYNSLDGADAVSAEEMEAFRRMRARVEDPTTNPAAQGTVGTAGYDLL